MLYHKTYLQPKSDQWVAFIHGVGGSSSIWFKQIRYYKEHFNVLLLDLRGHGHSQEAFGDTVLSRYSFEDIAKDVLEVLDHQNIAKAHFVGISMGTIVIRAIGELAPERIQSMVLGGAVTRLNIRSKFLMWVADQVKRFIPFMWLYSFYAYILMPRKHHKESRMLFINDAKKIAGREIMRWFTITSQVTPLLRYFEEKEIDAPVLYLMGDQDYMFLPQVKHIVQKHQHALLQTFEQCGHVVNIEQPDRFNRLSVNFMMNPRVYLETHKQKLAS